LATHFDYLNPIIMFAHFQSFDSSTQIKIDNTVVTANGNDFSVFRVAVKKDPSHSLLLRLTDWKFSYSCRIFSHELCTIMGIINAETVFIQVCIITEDSESITLLSFKLTTYIVHPVDLTSVSDWPSLPVKMCLSFLSDDKLQSQLMEYLHISVDGKYHYIVVITSHLSEENGLHYIVVITSHLSEENGLRHVINFF
jgi:hypothetical protein